MPPIGRRHGTYGGSMQSWRITQLALLVSVVFTAAGCYYRVENYGYSREFGIGKIGCQVATPMHAKSAPGMQSPRWQQIVAVTPELPEPATEFPPPMASQQPSDRSKGPIGSAEPLIVPDASAPKTSATLPPLTQFLPNRPPAMIGAPRTKNLPSPQPEKGWVGLPEF